VIQNGFNWIQKEDNFFRLDLKRRDFFKLDSKRRDFFKLDSKRRDFFRLDSKRKGFFKVDSNFGKGLNDISETKCVHVTNTMPNVVHLKRKNQSEKTFFNLKLIFST